MGHFFRVRITGSYDQADKMLKKMSDETVYVNLLNKYGAMGVAALADKTPVDSGKTALSWHYRVYKTKKGSRLAFYNSNMTVDDVPVAILIHYGHVTPTGYFVNGNDFINPIIGPLFEQLLADLEKEVA